MLYHPECVLKPSDGRHDAHSMATYTSLPSLPRQHQAPWASCCPSHTGSTLYTNAFSLAVVSEYNAASSCTCITLPHFLLHSAQVPFLSETFIDPATQQNAHLAELILPRFPMFHFLKERCNYLFIFALSAPQLNQDPHPHFTYSWVFSTVKSSAKYFK